MKSSKSNYLNIDSFKAGTLRKLREKGEERRTYPISKGDLLHASCCPLCGSPRVTPIAEVYLNSKLLFFKTVTCEKCLFTFRSVSPSIEWFNKCWDTIKTSKLEVFNAEIEKSRIERYENYYKIISKYITRGTLLDIGAAYGTGLDLFRNHGFKVFGIEPEINKINYIEKVFKIPVVSRSIREYLKTTKDKYNAVVFSQCLEHIDYPALVMKNIRTLLLPESVLYLEVPLMFKYVNWSDALYLAHKNNFTEENLMYLIHQSGLEVIDTFYYKPWDFGLLLKLSSKKLKNKKFRFRNRGKISLVREVYRKALPLGKMLPSDEVLRYTVPRIEQFFQTLKLDTKKMIVSPKTKSISFIDIR